MINTIKKSLKILRNNTIFIQPILLFFLTIMSILMFLNGRVLNVYSQATLVLSFVLLFIAFLTGWLHINKLGVVSYNEEDTPEEISQKSLKNFKTFFEGVGANFFRVLLVSVILFFIYVGVMYGLTKLCLHSFGFPEIYYDFQKLAKAASEAEMYNIINGISDENKIVFVKWLLVIYPSAVFICFYAVLTFSALFFEKTNVFNVFWKSIKFFFKNFIGCVFFIIFLKVLYLLINLISALIGTNAISLFIITMLLTIYLNYYLLLIFCYYYDKTKDNSDSGTELIGQEQTGN